MKNLSLAKSYLDKARKRLKILTLLLDEDDYPDVVREAQKIVELALKGMLRQIGIEPPSSLRQAQYKPFPLLPPAWTLAQPNGIRSSVTRNDPLSAPSH